MGAKCRARTPVSRCRGRALAISLSAVRAVLRLMQHSCGSARHRTSAVQQSWPAHVRHRSSKVRLRRGQTWPLYLQALCHFCSVRGPRGSRPSRLRRCGPCSAKTPQSLPGSQEAAVPAAGADSVSHRKSVRQHTPPPRIRAACHRLRRSNRFPRPDGQQHPTSGPPSRPHQRQSLVLLFG